MGDEANGSRVKTALVGDVRSNHPTNPEYFETVLRLLEEFMIEHHIDKIDVGWSRDAVLRSQGTAQ
jgi:hypothetical protein